MGARHSASMSALVGISKCVPLSDERHAAGDYEGAWDLLKPAVPLLLNYARKKRDTLSLKDGRNIALLSYKAAKLGWEQKRVGERELLELLEISWGSNESYVRAASGLLQYYVTVEIASRLSPTLRLILETAATAVLVLVLCDQSTCSRTNEIKAEARRILNAIEI